MPRLDVLHALSLDGVLVNCHLKQNRERTWACSKALDIGSLLRIGCFWCQSGLLQGSQLRPCHAHIGDRITSVIMAKCWVHAKSCEVMSQTLQSVHNFHMRKHNQNI